MKYTVVALALLMAACTEYVPSSVVSGTAPVIVGMKYIGRASSGIEGDPINGCWVYAFKLEGYYQTAMYCPSGGVATASAANQKEDGDNSATSSALQ